jgi:hypothetical protein
MIYAKKTTVSTDKSRAEIERILRRYGATAFGYSWKGSQAIIGFTLHDRHVRFMLPLPDRSEKRFTHSSIGPRSPEAAGKLWEQACRASWRALALVLKAKLEAVASKITTLEDEFLPHIVLPSGETVGEVLKPQIALAYEKGQMPQLGAPDA